MKKILVHQLKISFGAISEFAITAIFKCLPANTIKAIIEQYQQQTSCGLKPAENINIQQLQEMAASGLVTIGAHTINHPVLKNESDTGCRYEIAESVKQLELILEKPVKYLAYPNGRLHLDFGEREMNYLKESNISLVFSTELDHFCANNNPLSIPRLVFARMGLSPSNPSSISD